MWEGQGQRRVVQRGKTKKQREERRREEMGTDERRNRVDEAVVRGTGGGRRRIEKDRGRYEELKVSVRTVWSSELDKDAAAVTSVLISPLAG